MSGPCLRRKVTVTAKAKLSTQLTPRSPLFAQCTPKRHLGGTISGLLFSFMTMSTLSILYWHNSVNICCTPACHKKCCMENRDDSCESMGLAEADKLNCAAGPQTRPETTYATTATPYCYYQYADRSGEHSKF
eukprot:Selendium_serpulae@DN905_c0_g1_i1.p1